MVLWNFLLLGSFTAAADIDTIKSLSITHILTLDICPLPVRITELPFLKTKFIHGKLASFRNIPCHNQHV